MAGYIGNKAVGINVTTGDILGDVGVGGVVTANAGVVVDNFTLDGTTLALSSGNLIIDSEAGDIILDAHGHDYILKTATSAELAVLGDNTSGDFFIRVGTQDKDLIFAGNDGGAAITAMTIDMSAAGQVNFNAGLGIGGTGAANTLDDYEEGTFTVGFSGASMTLATATAAYTKVGSLVTWNFYSGASTVASASGTAKLTGLPFTVRGSSPSYVPLSIAHNSFFGGSATVGQQGYHDANGTFCVFVNVGTTTSSTFVNGSSKYIMVGGTYFTDA